MGFCRLVTDREMTNELALLSLMATFASALTEGMYAFGVFAPLDSSIVAHIFRF